jgi:hypothetical protein
MTIVRMIAPIVPSGQQKCFLYLDDFLMAGVSGNK